jgi:hypothetical protein
MSITLDKSEFQNKLLQEELIIIDMKTIGIIGLVLAVVGFLVGTYCQLEIFPMFSALDAQHDLTEIDRLHWRELADQKFILGSIALFLGALAAVVGLVLGLKKQKIGWIAIGLGLISFILGASQSTHLFS